MPLEPPIDLSSRLLENITDELRAANAMMSLGLEDPVVQGLAEAVAANLEYVFSFRWSPSWNPHQWREQDVHFTECVECGWLWSSPTAEDGLAAFEEHRATAHVAP